MAQLITKYTIFISSPSDLKEERESIDEVIKELNLTYGKANDCVIELLKWETHCAPGISNSYTQSIINNDIGEDYDIFLGMLWTKFGTATLTNGSGTEEEFNRALSHYTLDNKPQILFYFKTLAPTNLKDIDPEQLLKVDNFKKTFPKDKILYWEFDTIENLQIFLRLHIPKRLDALNQQSDISKVDLQVNQSQDEEELGLFDYYTQFEDLIGDATNSLSKIVESTKSIGVEIFAKAEQIKQISNKANFSINSVSPILIRTAKLMNDYTSSLEFEVPIFYKSFEGSIKAGINWMNLLEDFALTDDTIEQLKTSKEAMLYLIRTIPNALEGICSFKDSVIKIPRIQKEINFAKKILILQLESLIEKINKCLELSLEFNNQLGNKIDKLIINNERYK